MPVNFSELLDAKRLRPLWGPGQPGAPGDAAAKGEAGKSGEHAAIDPVAAAKQKEKEDAEADDAPPEPAPKESPLQLLTKLEQMLYLVLGPQAAMLQVYLQPLRRVIMRLDGKSAPPHPLATALQTGNLPMLIYRLEDSIRGLQRATQRLHR